MKLNFLPSLHLFATLVVLGVPDRQFQIPNHLAPNYMSKCQCDHFCNLGIWLHRYLLPCCPKTSESLNRNQT